MRAILYYSASFRCNRLFTAPHGDQGAPTLYMACRLTTFVVKLRELNLESPQCVDCTRLHRARTSAFRKRPLVSVIKSTHSGTRPFVRLIRFIASVHTADASYCAPSCSCGRFLSTQSRGTVPIRSRNLCALHWQVAVPPHSSPFIPSIYPVARLSSQLDDSR
ncbi:hypothetical protein GY45DRAFT_1030616 [Cubamyces sp. BRFM 1775]|nr:hypothetical protein GY45DRAFT_1030616 [Cubamyces sp. BRFM 1775]